MFVAKTQTRVIAVDQADSRTAFVRLCAAGFLAYCSYAICRAPLLPLFARELGADAPTVGLVVGASTVTGIFLKLPAGAWSDLLGRRPLLIAGGLVFALVPFGYLGVASILGLVILRVLHGFATAIFSPVASAAVADIAPPARRATWLSTYSTIQGTGQAIGPVVAGYLLVTGDYRSAFLAAGAIALAAPLIVTRWPATHQAAVTASRMTHFTRGIADVAREPLILVTSLAQAAQFVLHGTLSAFLPLFASEELGLTPAHLGWLFAVQIVTTLATRPIIGALSDRVGRRGVIAAGLTLCSVAVMLISLARNVPALVAGVVLYAIGVAVTTAATAAFITDLSHRARYGAAHGVFGTIYDVGDALGPIAAGFLVAAVGYARMFQVMAMVAAAMAVIFVLASRRVH